MLRLAGVSAKKFRGGGWSAVVSSATQRGIEMKKIFASVFALGMVLASPAKAAVPITGDPGLYWSGLVTSTIGGSPVLASRSIAMAQLAIFEAANATTGARYDSYLNINATSGADTRAAIATATYQVLATVNAARAADYAAARDASLALVTDGTAKSQGMDAGYAIAAAVLALRANDGSTATLPYTPQPVGTPGAWQPTPPGNLPAALPQWQNVTPWLMTNVQDFVSPPRPALTSQTYTDDFNEVKDWGGTVSAFRTADQSNSATVWASTLGVLPWENVAIDLAQSNGLDTTDSARMLALLAMGNADTIIALWKTKYIYDFWRPVTAIRGADIDGNASTLSDPTWSSFLTTPNYPSYDSGVSAIAANAATILTSYFGDTNKFCIVASAGQRCYDSFSSAEQAAADARIYGGMHFRFETVAGLQQGTKVANFTLGNALAPVPEPSIWMTLILGFGVIGAGLRRRTAEARLAAA
ncbi:MAG: PEP-CTERM sorting domain-containing protein [Sphingomonas sp.]